MFFNGKKKKLAPDAEKRKWEVFYEVVLLISFNHYVISILRKSRVPFSVFIIRTIITLLYDYHVNTMVRI